jgi:hypothetical protein
MECHLTRTMFRSKGEGLYNEDFRKGSHNEFSLMLQGCKRDRMVRRHTCFPLRGMSNGVGGTLRGPPA